MVAKLAVIVAAVIVSVSLMMLFMGPIRPLLVLAFVTAIGVMLIIEGY